MFSGEWWHELGFHSQTSDINDVQYFLKQWPYVFLSFVCYSLPRSLELPSQSRRSIDSSFGSDQGPRNICKCFIFKCETTESTGEY